MLFWNKLIEYKEIPEKIPEFPEIWHKSPEIPELSKWLGIAISTANPAIANPGIPAEFPNPVIPGLAASNTGAKDIQLVCGSVSRRNSLQ